MQNLIHRTRLKSLIMALLLSGFVLFNPYAANADNKKAAKDLALLVVKTVGPLIFDDLFGSSEEKPEPVNYEKIGVILKSSLEEHDLNLTLQKSTAALKADLDALQGLQIRVIETPEEKADRRDSLTDVYISLGEILEQLAPYQFETLETRMLIKSTQLAIHAQLASDRTLNSAKNYKTLTQFAKTLFEETNAEIAEAQTDGVKNLSCNAGGTIVDEDYVSRFSTKLGSSCIEIMQGLHQKNGTTLNQWGSVRCDRNGALSIARMPNHFSSPMGHYCPAVLDQLKNSYRMGLGDIGLRSQCTEFECKSNGRGGFSGGGGAASCTNECVGDWALKFEQHTILTTDGKAKADGYILDINTRLDLLRRWNRENRLQTLQPQAEGFLAAWQVAQSAQRIPTTVAGGTAVQNWSVKNDTEVPIWITRHGENKLYALENRKAITQGEVFNGNPTTTQTWFAISFQREPCTDMRMCDLDLLGNFRVTNGKQIIISSDIPKLMSELQSDFSPDDFTMKHKHGTALSIAGSNPEKWDSQLTLGECVAQCRDDLECKLMRHEVIAGFGESCLRFSGIGTIDPSPSSAVTWSVKPERQYYVLGQSARH